LKIFRTIKYTLLTGVLVFSVNVLSAQDEGEKEATSEEIAKELANPNTVLGTLAFQFDYLNYQGDLNNVNSQNSLAINFSWRTTF
jgi:hypothetical protein